MSEVKTVRIEARKASTDEEYVNAIVVPEEDADTVRAEWEKIYGHVSTPSDESPETPEFD